MSLEDRISIGSSVRSGKPCVRGTRITGYDILEYLAGGMSEDQILEDLPALTPRDVRAALEFADPPKVISLPVGDANTQAIADPLRSSTSQIQESGDARGEGLLVLVLPRQ